MSTGVGQSFNQVGLTHKAYVRSTAAPSSKLTVLTTVYTGNLQSKYPEMWTKFTFLFAILFNDAVMLGSIERLYNYR
jgi:hypothetical protein